MRSRTARAFCRCTRGCSPLAGDGAQAAVVSLRFGSLEGIDMQEVIVDQAVAPPLTRIKPVAGHPARMVA